MNHIVLLYYIIAFCLGISGVFISYTSYLKQRDKFIKDYLVFFLIFGLKVIEIIFMFYIFTNVSENIKVLDISYTVCAIITFIFYTAMLKLINEVFELPHKKIRNYIIFGITLLLMFVGMASYRIDLINQKMYMSNLFFAVNVYCIAAIFYVIINGIIYSKNIKNDREREINQKVIKLFIMGSPLTIMDSLNLFGGKIINLGDKFSVIYFLPIVFVIFTIWFALYLKKQEEILTDDELEIELCGSLFFENIEEEIVERYKISVREKEVLMKLLNGKSNKEIAEELEISINTVKTHLNNIYGKIGVRKRYEILKRLNISTLAVDIKSREREE